MVDCAGTFCRTHGSVSSVRSQVDRKSICTCVASARSLCVVRRREPLQVAASRRSRPPAARSRRIAVSRGKLANTMPIRSKATWVGTGPLRGWGGLVLSLEPDRSGAREGTRHGKTDGANQGRAIVWPLQLGRGRKTSHRHGVRPERTKRPSGTHKREMQRPAARVLNESSELQPSGMRLSYVS
jgi:hypothetical protein